MQQDKMAYRDGLDEEGDDETSILDIMELRNISAKYLDSNKCIIE